MSRVKVLGAKPCNDVNYLFTAQVKLEVRYHSARKVGDRQKSIEELDILFIKDLSDNNPFRA